MAKAEWSDGKDGVWFASYQGRRISMSFCIEELSENCFEASYCHLDESDYTGLGTFDDLKVAKKALEAYAVDVNASSIGKRS